MDCGRRPPSSKTQTGIPGCNSLDKGGTGDAGVTAARGRGDVNRCNIDEGPGLHPAVVISVGPSPPTLPPRWVSFGRSIDTRCMLVWR